MRTRDLEIGAGSGVADEVADFVGTLAREADLPASKAYWLRLAVEEITINIGQHGYRGRGPVRLTSEIAPDRVWLRIEDEAPAFDPRNHDSTPRLETAPPEREIGGFGLLLALYRLDGFCYERVGGWNRNTLTMLRTSFGDDPGLVDGVSDGVEERADHR